MKKNIVIVHYNTPYLTECLVRSINLFVRDAVIHIFDNSDKQPFTAKFDNVTLLDNTKGQYIDFDKWLNKYPNRNTSNGRINKWGSAKHCYSVEKCIELVGENFILLDSDILLKRDISELFDSNYIYIGEEIVQPLSTIKRVLPFLCFINVDMCKENNVHYFTDEYMHGLYKSMNSDRYDTGAGFYALASKFNHKAIHCNDYIVHYGHGSWNKRGAKSVMTPGEWINRYRKYWSDDKNDKVIYTCITGDYDKLAEPKVIANGFDYVCFTDNANMTSDVWEIRPLPNETDALSQVKKQRYVKINPHKVLPDYKLSIWVDGNMEIVGDINALLENVMKDDVSVYVPQHPQRDCIYKEAKVVISMKKDKAENVNPQISRYRKEGFPERFGLLQSNIIIRKHNEEDCIRLMEAWYDEVSTNSHRDQLSFNYVLWKNSDISVIYLDKYIYKSEWFKWRCGHSKSTVKSSTVIRNEKSNSSRLVSNREAFRNLINSSRLRTYDIKVY